MSRSGRTVSFERIAPVATVLTLGAAASMSFTGTAGATTHHVAKPRAAKPAVTCETQSTKPAVNNTVCPDFGLGKVYVEAMPGTYPPSFTGNDIPDFLHPDLYVVVSDPDDGDFTDAYCSPNDPGVDTTPPSCEAIDDVYDGDSWTAGPLLSDSSVPDGWLEPNPISGVLHTGVAGTCKPLIPQVRAHVARSARPALSQFLGACNLGTLEVPGTWRQISLTVDDIKNGEPVPGVTLELDGPAAALPTPPEQPGAKQAHGTAKAHRARPSDSSVMIATATTNSNGVANFGWISSAQAHNLTATASNVPAGFANPSVAGYAVPGIFTPAQAGHPYSGLFGLTPVSPTLRDDSSKGDFGAKQVIDVLSNDTAVSAPLTLLKTTQPAHGSAHVDAKTQQVTFTPAKGFSGSTTFTYTARNALGASGTATVNVTVGPEVLPKKVVHQPATLPFTGFDETDGTVAGVGALALGSMLMLLGVRRRTD
jgi:hypothetical protein